MKHVVTQPSPPFLALGGRLEVHQVPVWQDNLVWIAVCTETGVAAAIDGPEAAPVLAYARAHGLRLKTLLNTHTHGDHIGINRALAKDGQIDDWRVVGSTTAPIDIPGLTQTVGDGDVVSLGALTAKVLLTEGHINGHICFFFGPEDGVLFCGDTLFSGGCGYLFDGPPAKMHDSLMRLAQLPGDTRVCCGHEYTEDNLKFAWSVEPDNEALADRIRRVWAIRSEGRCTVPSTLEEERATNPFLRPGAPTLLAHVRAAWPDRTLRTPAEVFAATRALKDRKTYRAMDEGGLPL